MGNKKITTAETGGNRIEITEPVTTSGKEELAGSTVAPYEPIIGHSPQYRHDQGIDPGKTYFDLRMQALGVTTKLNTIIVKKTVQEPDLLGGTTKHETTQKDCIFYETETGNIGIKYYDLNGLPQTYKPSDAEAGEANADKRWRKHYHRWRLNPDNIDPENADTKYIQAKGSDVHIFFTPGLIEKARIGLEIKTLYMVEGEMKAFAGYIAGLDIIGLPSINGYQVNKDVKALHHDIYQTILLLKPQNLIFLVDADALTINWHKWDKDIEHYDLAKRLNLFYKCAEDIREYTKALDCDTYYADMTPTLSHNNYKIREAKGLDDLLGVANINVPDVLADLERFTGAREFFKFINLSTEKPQKVKQYFMLNLSPKRVPENFYFKFRERIEPRDSKETTTFIFGGFKYKYDNADNTLKTIGHPDGEKYVRVGPKYFKLIYVPHVKDTLIRKIEPWQKGEIIMDYVQAGYPDFFSHVGKYNAFCNVPCNDENYQQVVHECYNLYSQLEWKPAPGPHPTIDTYLNHIFGDKIDIGMDYLTLLYRNPRQKLPILTLYSKERGTGKTKFMELLNMIFGENMNIIGNDEITDKFNDDYAGKLIIGIDEAIIEKRAVIEKIKSWVFRQTINLATKNISRNTIAFNGHFIFTTNEEAFVQIPPEENRFFILKVPTFEKEDPNILDKCQEEIEAFLHTLKTRPLTHTNETRLFFRYDLLKTEMLAKVVESGRSYKHKTILRFIRDKFLEFEELELKICLWHLHGLMNQEIVKFVYPISQDDVEKVLKDEFKLEPIPKPLRYKFPVWNKHEIQDNIEYVVGYSDQYIDHKNNINRPINAQRYYILAWDKFLTENDLTDQMRDSLKKLRVVDGTITIPKPSAKDDDMPF